MATEIKIYVYGSCYYPDRLEANGGAGNGGYGVLITEDGELIEEVSGGFAETQSARMDIIGITEGLKRISPAESITVYLSNVYVIHTLTKGWLEKWKKTGFVNKKHADLWVELDNVIQTLGGGIRFRHSIKVKNAPEFRRAKELAKAMSGKVNLPNDPSRSEIYDSFTMGPLNTVVENDATFALQDDRPYLDNSICVDASCIGNPGPTEYRGIDPNTGKLLFQMKYEQATNNIGEFLAIVHALALSKKEGRNLRVIYSDSYNAISWVRQKKCKTKFEKTERNVKVFDHIERATRWLENNTYETRVMKWNTAAWGEIPADYGRKK